MRRAKREIKTPSALVSFIGYGRMGSALAEGAVTAGVLKAADTVVYARSEESRRRALKAGFLLAARAQQAVEASDIVFLCMKPQQIGDFLGLLKNMRTAGRCFVSIAAGVTIERIQKAIDKKASVIRVMPNTPALVGAGMSAVSLGKNVPAVYKKVVCRSLKALGEMVEIPERAMDTVTALSGSGPAYVFYLAEAMAEGAAQQGLPRSVAERLARQTLYGAGCMLAKRAEPAAELRRQVTSPGGTTAAAITEFDRRKFKEIVARALQKAAERSKELSNV